MDNRISVACKLADHILWESYAQSTDGDEDCATHILFPQLRDQNLRVSEQEARFAFVEALCQGPLLYSVETPTRKTYKFTDKTQRPQSAQTDLSVHYNKSQCICNVEFKAKGVSRRARELFRIYKDIQKLLREPVWGLWFHLLESVNKSTINNLLEVITTKIDEVQNEFKDIDSEGLTLHVCVLKHGFSLERDIPFRANGPMNIHVDLRVSQTELLEVVNLNGWTIHRW